MKRWFLTFPLVYMIVTISMGLLAVLTNLVPAIQNDISVQQLVVGSLTVSLLIHSAINVYRLKWGNGLWSIICSFLIILPIAPIARRIYFPLLARLVWLVYLLIFIYVMVYTITIAVQHARNKKMSADLNRLLGEKKKTKK